MIAEYGKPMPMLAGELQESVNMIENLLESLDSEMTPLESKPLNIKAQMEEVDVEFHTYLKEHGAVLE